VVVDLGGGTFNRFGASGARIQDLDLIVLTHLHADHATELPALLKSAYFSPRTRALPIAGPTGGGRYPGLQGYLDGLFDPERGAFRYLSGYLDGSDGLFALEPVTIDASLREPRLVLSDASLRVSATGVTHGPVPALAYRVEIGSEVVVFGGDQNGDDPSFVDFARGADLLVMHHAVPEHTGRIAANLHALPSELGEIAHKAGARHLVLSHLMPRSERTLEASRALMREHFKGKITVAEDLMCIVISE
jgi:ribonuclease BN (tRNA processing enzyme)